MHLIHLTDLHFGCADEQALKAAGKYIESERPDLVVITGDISKDGLAHELQAACDWMRALPVPVMLTPGNHDVPYYNPIGRIFYPWTRFARAAQGIQTDIWSTPDWHIVPVNTARGIQLRLNWAQGAISRAQTERAGEALGQAQPGALKIVITHHPLDWPNDAPIHGATLGGARAMTRLVEAGAELFLSGHLHFASARMVGERALSITSGTLSQRVRHEPCAFTAIRRPAPDRIETQVLHVVQGVVECAAKREFRLGATRLEPQLTPAPAAPPLV